jgi:hypothetical protein
MAWALSGSSGSRCSGVNTMPEQEDIGQGAPGQELGTSLPPLSGCAAQGTL